MILIYRTISILSFFIYALLFADCNKTVQISQAENIPDESPKAISLSSLRNLENIDVDALYETIDFGGGKWKAAPGDDSSKDNTGTVIMTKRGKRLQRVESKQINLAWFGAKGDGLKDEADIINTAINSKEDVEVVVPKGTYRISEDIVKNKGSLILTFEEGASLFVDGKRYKQGINKGVLNFNNLSSLVLDNIIIDGNRYSFPTISNVFSNVPTGIFVRNSDNITIKNCRLTNMPSLAMWLYNSRNFRIEKNLMERPYGHGIFVQFGSDGVIRDNFITGLGDEVTTNLNLGGIGILMQRAQRINVEGNNILDMTDTGTKSEGCDDIVWRRNYILRPGKDGIKFQDFVLNGVNITHVKGCLIEANAVQNLLFKRKDGSGCIVVYSASDVKIINNSINSHTRKKQDGSLINDDKGIFLQSGASVTENVLVEGNTLNNTPIAVDVNKVSKVSIQNNKIYECYSGILFSNVNSIDVINNSILNKEIPIITGYGIGSTGQNNYEINVTGNSIRNVSAGISLNINSSDSIIVRSNFMEGLAKNGIIIASQKYGTTVKNLTVAQNYINKPLMKEYQTIVEVNTNNLTVNEINFTKNNINGNGNFSNNCVTVNGTGKIKKMDLTGTNHYGKNIKQYNICFITVDRAIGYRCSAPPALGSWQTGDMIYNDLPNSITRGWKCVLSGKPRAGSWTPF